MGTPVAVMVVDDLGRFREAAARVIGVSPGFICVCEAASGEQALATLEEQRVDLVLMDVLMPGMGGVAAAEQIRRHHPSTAVILMSACEEAELPSPLPAGYRFCPKMQFGPDALEELWRQRDIRTRQDHWG